MPPPFLKSWKPKIWPVNPFPLGGIQISNIQSSFITIVYHHKTCQSSLRPDRSTIILKMPSFFLKNWKSKIWFVNSFSFDEIQILNIQSSFIIIVHHHCSSSLNLSIFIGMWQINNNSESAFIFFEKLKVKNLICKPVFIQRNTNLEHSIIVHHHQTC